VIGGRRLLVPEVVQTSVMDCGPAVLAAALRGLGVRVHAGHLREACQTEVDGTSIQTLEAVARRVGIDAVQTLVPPAHLPLAAAVALPAVVVLQRPDRSRHFLLLWRRLGAWVQVMDPARGRLWMRWSDLRGQLYHHEMHLDGALARSWRHSPAVVAGLGCRLQALGLDDDSAAELLGAALSEGWVGRLEDALGAVEDLRAGRAVARGGEAERLLHAFIARPRSTGTAPAIVEADGALQARCAVVLLLRPPRPAAAATASGSLPAATRPTASQTARPAGAAAATVEESALQQALSAPPERPLRDLVAMVRTAQPGFFAIATAVAVASAAGALVQTALFRALLDAGRWLQTPSSRAAAVALILALGATLAAVGASWGLVLTTVARRLELAVRQRVHAKLPRLAERTFTSRLAADLAERAHAVSALRGLPASLSAVLTATAGVAASLTGIVYLDPSLAGLALASAATMVALPAALHGLLARRELVRQTYDGALSRVYLDAMLGAVVVRAHGAEETLRREHEDLLVGWRRAAEQALAASVGAGLLQGVVGLGLAAAMVHQHLATATHGGSVLLLVYWATGLPRQGQSLASAARALPALQSVGARVLEILHAPEEPDDTLDDLPDGALSVRLAEARVQVGGRTLLAVDELTLTAGEHVAVVGPSGAGKSTLVGLLLGVHPAQGTVEVGGHQLTPERGRALRRRTAWVDPSVTLWNRSLVDNLRYGHEDAPQGLDAVLQQADLLELTGELPGGMAGPLGQGGGLLSGGQGQRVRLGRALGRPDVGLVLLDEAFRGLDRGQRRERMQAARSCWGHQTLLAVTHDAADTTTFQRVLVVEDGRIVEDGSPAELLAAGGRYARLVEGDRRVREELLGGDGWRHLAMGDGQVREAS